MWYTVVVYCGPVSHYQRKLGLRPTGGGPMLSDDGVRLRLFESIFEVVAWAKEHGASLEMPFGLWKVGW